MSDSTLTLILGDQLTHDRGALRGAEPRTTTVLMAEVAVEAAYVPHNRHKIALIFSAMRHFRDELLEAGYRVIYYDFAMGVDSLGDALDRALSTGEFTRVACCEPGEYRVQKDLDSWSAERDIPLDCSVTTASSVPSRTSAPGPTAASSCAWNISTGRCGAGTVCC